ncbi:MAG: long-chain fatty acid--CoA ligase [Flavobacterium sp.]|nr:MAG: long-chain fatty acid--CoA ligase [Flavobacterium sp.]
MYNPTYRDVHNKFKLNGFHLDRDDLCRVAYSFIKEGEPFEKPVGDFLLDWFDDKDYIEMQTSGSTGVPKLIRVKKQAMVNSSLATGDFFDINPGDKVLNCLPVKYVAGKLMFVRSFILGLDMEFVAPSSKPLKNNDVVYDFSAMVPLQAQNSLNELHMIKKLIVGGAKINTSLEQQLLKLPTKSFETYGMTETVSHIAAKNVGEKSFTVLPNVTVDKDERGCLVIHAPNISESPIVTNDLVDLISDTEFIFLGRLDNVINSGGIKFSPEMIEEKLTKKISDRRFFIAGVPDADLGEKLILVIEGEQYDLPEKLFDKLDKYEKPKEVVFIPQFKETGNGKIIRKDSLL